MPDRHLRTVASLFGAIVVASPLAGQTVRGRVAVLDIADPVPGAAVVLMSVDGRAHDATISDSGGRFELRTDSAGTYFVHAFAPGFAEVRSDRLALGEGMTVEVRVNLRPVAVLIEGITVYGQDRFAGFHDRREDRQNYRFRSFDAVDIERHHADRVGAVLGEVPLFRGRCFELWLDGERVPEDDWRRTWIISGGQGAPFPIDWVHGVEVFRNRGDAPERFQRFGSSHCGVVLVWTKLLGGQ